MSDVNSSQKDDASTRRTKTTGGACVTKKRGMRPSTSSEDSVIGTDPRRAVLETAKKFLGADQWTWFVTLTFRNPRSTVSGVSSALRSWLSQFNRVNCSDRFRLVLWSVELQRRGSAHIHALMAGGRNPASAHCSKCQLPVQSLPHRVLKESWYYHFGIARFMPYDDSVGNGGVCYVTKYVLSDECEDWGLWEAGKDF